MSEKATGCITRTGPPIACGGRFRRNFAHTVPELPCGRVTRPQITRNFEPFLRVRAL